MKTTLPPFAIPPSNNVYYRHVGHKVLLSRAGRDYRTDVCNRIVEQFGFGKTGFPLTGPLKLTIVYHRPDLRRRDIDNLQKGLLDSLTHAGVYEDDSQIEHLDVRFAPLPLTEKRGTVEVTIQPLKPAKKPRN